MSYVGQDQSFRDHIGTVDQKGKRIWLHPTKPKGRIYRWRTVTSLLQFALLFGLPFLKINGHPAVLFQIVERKLFFFGWIFRPQDSYLLALLIISFTLLFLLFTAVFGRIWCGWLCPQTIFLEMMFRRIEFLIEGDSAKQRKLKKSPWNFNKIVRKTAKQIIFLTISFVISNFFLSFVIGMDELWKIIHEPLQDHAGLFSGLVAFTLVFYGVFAWFREQACIAVCPYGRLQSALQDKNTMMVTYDYKRGEPRGKVKNRKVTIEDILGDSQQQESSSGDCVDCMLCVRVCPTGIDIRNGMQMECVNCTACIDSCNHMMDLLGRPRGLIRYSSAEMIETSTKFRFTVRMWSYTIAFALLFSLTFFLFLNHSFIGVMVTRVPGVLYQQVDDTHVANIYDMQLLNNTFHQKIITVAMLDPKEGEIRGNQDRYVLEGDSALDVKFLIVVTPDMLKGANAVVTLGVYEDGVLFKTVKTAFSGPAVGSVK